MERYFEWDPEKEQKNVKKHHGLNFDDALLVFEDLERIERYDEEHSDEEDRWQTIGIVGDTIFVVYSEQEDEIYRIISARIATSKEKELYYGDYTKDIEGWYKANQ
ncbi:hypothetical protein FACS1894164_11800 [Spirochaetia bacterium]|nr:hypothetical protein FACS1894164_11800 [Spirochaetia bacterium]